MVLSKPAPLNTLLPQTHPPPRRATAAKHTKRRSDNVTGGAPDDSDVIPDSEDEEVVEISPGIPNLSEKKDKDKKGKHEPVKKAVAPARLRASRLESYGFSVAAPAPVSTSASASRSTSALVSASSASTPPTSRSSVLATPSISTRTAHSKGTPRQHFLGVVITKSAPRVARAHPPSAQAIVDGAVSMDTSLEEAAREWRSEGDEVGEDEFREVDSASAPGSSRHRRIQNRYGRRRIRQPVGRSEGRQAESSPGPREVEVVDVDAEVIEVVNVDERRKERRRTTAVPYSVAKRRKGKKGEDAGVEKDEDVIMVDVGRPSGDERRRVKGLTEAEIGIGVGQVDVEGDVVRENLRFLRGGGDGASRGGKTVAVASESLTEAFLERLKATFGEGGNHRGAGRKPKARADVISSETASEWDAALQPLLKGKRHMDREGLREVSRVLGLIEGGQEEEVVRRVVGSSVVRLAVLCADEIPLGDGDGLRDRAGAVAARWREARSIM